MPGVRVTPAPWLSHHPGAQYTWVLCPALPLAPDKSLHASVSLSSCQCPAAPGPCIRHEQQLEVCKAKQSPSAVPGVLPSPAQVGTAAPESRHDSAAGPHDALAEISRTRALIC